MGRIAKYGIKAVLYAQGIIASKGKEFYGDLTFSEQIEAVKIKAFKTEFSDSLKHRESHPAKNNINEHISGVEFDDFMVWLNENLNIER